MKPNTFAIGRSKVNGFISKIRVRYYKLLGLTFGKGCKIGKIECDWNNNVKMGDDCVVLDGVRLGIGDPFNEQNTIELGNRVFIGHNVEFNCTGKIKIGDDCLIASDCTIVDVNHIFKLGKKINQQSYTSHHIIIEKDVWIGAQCVILGGILIEEGSIVAAGSVVNKSIPSFQIWGGVPAKFIKNRV